jgi:hypothetical protein
MKTSHTYWYIAVKRIEPIPGDLKEKLISMGVTVLEGKVYIHAHIFIPESVYLKVEEFFKKSGFEITSEHPSVCSIGEKPDFEIFEKRVPIIEAQEAKFLAEMAEYGVLMSGGAGKPHVHLSIPQEKREEALSVLDENHYFLKEFSC